MSAPFAIADERERKPIRDRVDENMCVEAGAGTGKTTVLVDRIVRLLSTTDTDVRHIAVITFTEKAAAELAARVRRGLEDALGGAGEPTQRARLEAALRGLNHAHIETIHAFAASLLRERPIEADLDPGFEVLDVLPAQLEFETQYREWLAAEMAADPPPPSLVGALNLGLPLNLVRDAAEQLHRNREMLPLTPYPTVDVDAAAAIDALAPHMDVLASLSGRGSEEDLAHQALLFMLEWYVDTRFRSERGAIRRAVAMFDMPGYNGNQKNWRIAQDCRDAKAALDRIKKILTGCKGGMRQNAVGDLITWLQGFVNQYDRHRRNNGKADFDDLLIWARNLIRDHADVRAYFQSKFERVFVDEFQDTDPLQVELIVSLCAEGTLPGDWRHAKIRPGSLFVVGDPKQSIYRFRRADIAMYDEVKSHVFGGEPVRIVQNFRSASPIIEWVNRTFTQLFIEQEGVQPPYVDLAHRPDYEIEDAVTTLRGKSPVLTDGSSRIDGVRRYEAGKLAALIKTNVEGGTWLVRTSDGGDRPAAYRDVVVLIPSRTQLQIYEDEFARAALPFRHEGGRTFFLRQEVREFVAVLRAIDDPGDAVAAVAALRSSAFGCSDEDLLLHRHAGGRFDFTSVRADAEGHVATSLRTLKELASLRHTVTLPELVRAVLDKTRLVEFAMLQPHGEQIAANLLKIIDQARTFSDATGRGLRGFVRWLKDNVNRVTDETDASISEETDDVVRIITIHASKGLEFPIVVFANMAGERRSRTTVVADRVGRRLHIQLGKQEDSFRTPGCDDAMLDEQRHFFAEELRLLYVAATRAKDRLVVSFIAEDDKDAAPKAVKCLADHLRLAGAHLTHTEDLDALALPEGELPIWRGAIDQPARPEDVASVHAARKTWIVEHDALVERGNTRLLVQTATALKPEFDPSSSFAADAIRRGRAAEFGTAVHALLERAVLRADRIDAFAAATAREFGMEARIGEMAAVARRALQSGAVKRALASKRLLLETPFTLALPDLAGLAEGRIDLLFEEDSALVIVDFKTDAVNANDVEERSASYRNQALVYSWSAHRATSMPVREVILLFARPDPAIERSFPVDAAFLAEAEALIVQEPAIA